MRKILFAIALAFGLNFVWEIAQSFLYAPHYEGFGQLVSVHLLASLSDVVMIFFILLLDEIIFGYILKNGNLKIRLSGISLFGFMLSVAVEKYALANSIWAYGSWMPILPYFDVGLMPVLQMMLIPAAVFLFWQRSLKK
jgi:hypothetical protein